jgi:putative chitinase
MEIAELNNMDNPDALRVGQVLEIPVEEEKEEEEKTATPAKERLAPVRPAEFVIIAVEQLREIMTKATEANISKYAPALNDEMAKYEINTPQRIAHFIAQIAHESGSFRYSSENLNYSAGALRTVFGKYFKSDELANEYARKPEKIANRVYANRMGNGDEASGDGWKYRGRGLIQLTGKENYTRCGEGIGRDLVSNPDQLATDAHAAVAASGWYWNSRGLNAYADKDDVETITRKINGGLNGINDRRENLMRAKIVLGLV